MSSPERSSAKSQTSSDSLFGMALARAFTGLAFGSVFDYAWEACEAASAMYEDRFAKPAAKSNGATRSLTEDFTRGIEAPRPYGLFGLSFPERPFAPAPAI